ncbi:MAG: UDP-2,3-diacylglucosamine diphosphatase LpxI [Kiritimatiellae bacterium]|nr:UDP-2,3-diacylglucosamine diphosphatase LpxI [Kiritimatiellia bacterium]
MKADLLDIPDELAVIAGRGAYPLMLAESARRQGVRKIFAAAFKNETERAIEKLADETLWFKFGQLGAVLEAVKASGVKHAVMAGQITPLSLFRLRPDAKALALLAGMRQRNARTIFGAVCAEFSAIGVQLLPAWQFMENSLPKAGQLSLRPPTEREQKDIELGMRAAKAVSALEIGQTVVVKEGVILAVEAFEGTDQTILRAGDLGGTGAVVVKTARNDHDMRYDIPVVGLKTMKILKKIKAAALAVEAGRTIMLEPDKIIAEADRMGLALVAVDTENSRHKGTEAEGTK